jgi:hypothetical protein
MEYYINSRVKSWTKTTPKKTEMSLVIPDFKDKTRYAPYVS